MKSFRLTYIAFLLVLALVAFTMYDAKRFEKAEEQKRQNEKVIGIAVDDIQKIELINRSSSIIVERQDGQWYLRAPLADTADHQAVLSFLASIEAERIMSTVSAGGEVNLATYGLAPSGESSALFGLKVFSSQGRHVELRLGSIKAYDGSLYAQIRRGKSPIGPAEMPSDMPGEIFLLSSSWDSHLSKPVGEFRDKRLFRGGLAGDVERIEIREKGQSPLLLEKSSDSWKISGETYPVYKPAVDGFIEQIKALRGLEFADEDKAVPGVIARRGLSSPALRIELRSQSAASATPAFTLLLSEDLKDESNVFAVSSDLQPVVSLSSAAVGSVRKRVDDFLDKKFPFRFSVADVERVEIDSPAVRAKFVKSGESWSIAAEHAEPSEQRESKDGQKTLDSAKLKEMLEKLSRFEAVRILSSAQRGQKASSNSKDKAKIRLLNSRNEPIFEINWGELVTEKSKSDDRPEMTYRIGHTNLSDRKLGISDASIEGLQLAGLLTTAQPSASPVQAETKKTE